jgi:23S rRNA-/tRNA-specific pseudouridylate synthase
MHQIRVHLAHEGFPVLGDMLYGDPKSNRLLFKDLKIKKQFLHCWQYSFFDTFSNKQKDFSVDAPSYFKQVMKNK